jgi:UDP-N-acetylmuramoyl-tripeptide--D-alanyl-D-alanine ligase
VIPKAADLLVAIGPRAKFFSEGAAKAGMAKKNIMKFDTTDEALLPLQGALLPGDLVLVKAAHAMNFEAVIKEIESFEEAMAEGVAEMV